jgi:hypothetical protein
VRALPVEAHRCFGATIPGLPGHAVFLPAIRAVPATVIAGEGVPEFIEPVVRRVSFARSLYAR